jgi:hypothetical protein
MSAVWVGVAVGVVELLGVVLVAGLLFASVCVAVAEWFATREGDDGR